MTAVATRARLGDVRRFRNGRMAAAYMGLTPRVHRSSDIQRNGRITKEGDRTLRWLLIQAAWATLRTRRGRLWRVFEKLCARKGATIVIVAVARRLLILLFNLLRTQTTFRGARAATVRRKQKPLLSPTPVAPATVSRRGRQPGAPCAHTSRRPTHKDAIASAR